MVGKAGRSGRPAGATTKFAYQVRLEEREAEAFDELVSRREAEAAKVGARANASSVLQAMVRKTLQEEGLLTDATAPSAPEPSKPRRNGTPAPPKKAPGPRPRP
jgi:hypothetical protein